MRRVPGVWGEGGDDHRTLDCEVSGSSRWVAPRLQDTPKVPPGVAWDRSSLNTSCGCPTMTGTQTAEWSVSVVDADTSAGLVEAGQPPGCKPVSLLV